MGFNPLLMSRPIPTTYGDGVNTPMLAANPSTGGILSRFNLFPENLSDDARSARADALVQLGLGMIQGNTGNYGAIMPSLAAGGIAGFQGYKNALREQAQRRQAMLQERLINSQIGENQAQMLERQRKTSEANRIVEARRKVLEQMDAEYGVTSQSDLPDNYKTPLEPGQKSQEALGGIVAPVAEVNREKLWYQTPAGLREAARRLEGVGDLDTAKLYNDKAKAIADEEFNQQRLDKEKAPPQKLTVGAPTGGNEQWDYVFDPTGKAPGPRLPQDQRYVLAGKRQAVASTTNTIDMRGEQKYTEAFGTKVADADFSLMEAARKAPDMADTANTVMRILREGKPITGFGADFRRGFASAAQGLGIRDESVADSQLLGQALAKTTMDAIKSSGLGAGQGFTNTDREFLEKAAAGQINFDEKSLYRAAELNYRSAKKAVEKWQRRYDSMPKSAREATNIERDIPLPPAYSFTPKEPSRAAPPKATPNQPKVLRFDSKGNLIK